MKVHVGTAIYTLYIHVKLFVRAPYESYSVTVAIIIIDISTYIKTCIVKKNLPRYGILILFCFCPSKYNVLVFFFFSCTIHQFE